jgi:hypothetical protein
MNHFRLAVASYLLLALASGHAATPPAAAAASRPRSADSCEARLGAPLAFATPSVSWSRAASPGGPEWSAVDDSSHGARHALNLPDHGTHRYSASLTTPAFVVPPAGIVIEFAQRRDWSWANTVGVLEAQVAGRDFVDVIAAGGRFLDGAYDGRSFASNPLGERPAWASAPGSYVATRLLLPATLASQSLRLRLRAGSAGTGDEAPGWFVVGFECADPH